jgi:GNAT superfamily N-acetyltransferase
LRVISRRNKPDKRCRFPAPELDASKVAAALAHSTVVAAAYVTDSGGGGDASAGAALSNNGAPREPALGGWLSLLPRAPQRRLVGFARAAGDATLVALVADVAVAPQHRKTGVGARLVAAVLDELRALGVADVGALSSDAMRPFFRSVSTPLRLHHRLRELTLAPLRIAQQVPVRAGLGGRGAHGAAGAASRRVGRGRRCHALAAAGTSQPLARRAARRGRARRRSSRRRRRRRRARRAASHGASPSAAHHRPCASAHAHPTHTLTPRDTAVTYNKLSSILFSLCCGSTYISS